MMIEWFFLFKQKTAYEMRISDWSSDVCSSDLHDDHQHHRLGGRTVEVEADEAVVEHLVDQRVGRPGGAAPGGGVDGAEGVEEGEIGRASCRDRLCQYV